MPIDQIHYEKIKKTSVLKKSENHFKCLIKLIWLNWHIVLNIIYYIIIM